VGVVCVAHQPLPWRGFYSLSDELVGGILVVGASVLQVCGWSWSSPVMVGGCAVPWSSADGFGWLLWSSSLVSGAQGSSTSGCGWSRVLLFTGGGLGG
jgi:hypothetical protein